MNPHNLSDDELLQAASLVDDPMVDELANRLGDVLKMVDAYAEKIHEWTDKASNIDDNLDTLVESVGEQINNVREKTSALYDEIEGYEP